ncbi:ABC transporter substrate-binding protein [Sediminispirochaeta smaragdinae]|uniref:Extracellular solute-binding protein family 1 n=1 Tax=Sediminispirochaeta smaragdinae (strain DSM 11293 / JCM 15392 / SEBR 4228) TaxID=573413 RepID=E1R156_SEDSS|nr:extracellular solute-binding protein [Sediminispirochaeta smaragdinae]ADK80876.1 extracellular solute-binding protein family 1 [Sediminispirochaeta smaragdinae DSM 11293]
MRKRLSILALIALTLLGSLYAGGTQEGASDGSIEYVSMWNAGEPQAIFMETMAKQFEEETGIKVDITFAGRDVLTKIRSRLLMQDAPDLIDQDFSELSGALLKDDNVLVEPLNDFLYKTEGPEGQKQMMDLFDEHLVKLYAKDDSIYFFPYEFITSGFFYDKTLFAEHGLASPENWKEFIDINQQLTSAGVPALALDGNISFYNAYYYYWALTRVMGPGHLKDAAADASGKVWDDPGYLSAARMVYELSAGGKNFFQPGYAGSNYPAAQADWALNKSGSILCGTWIPSETKEQQVDGFEVGFYPFPEVSGGKGSSADVEAYLIGFAIPTGAKNIEGAKAFMKYISRKENAEKLAHDTINIAARRDASYPDLLTEVKPVVEHAENFHVSYDGAMQLYPEWFANVFYPADNDLVFGKITPEAFIARMKSETARYWESKK